MTFKQFNLHPMLRGEALSKILFIHKEIRRLYFSRLIEQICCSCTEEETISFHGTQRARHCLSLRPDHKNTQRDNIHNIDRTRKQRHALTRTCTPKCAPKHTHTHPITHAHFVSGDGVCPEGCCPAVQAGRHFCRGGPFVSHQTKRHSFAYGSTNFC